MQYYEGTKQDSAVLMVVWSLLDGMVRKGSSKELVFALRPGEKTMGIHGRDEEELSGQRKDEQNQGRR